MAQTRPEGHHQKPIAYKQIKPTIELLQKAGIFTCAFFVIGLPGETRAERQETRDAIYDWGLDWSFFNYATPLRGSELFRICKENNWIEEKYLPIGAIDMTEYVITAPGMDRQEIKRTVFDMNLDLNFVNNHNLRTGNLTTAYQAFREVVGRHPGQPFAQYFLGKCLEQIGATRPRSQNTTTNIGKSSHPRKRGATPPQIRLGACARIRRPTGQAARLDASRSRGIA